MRAFAALDQAGEDALRRDLEQLWTRHNQAPAGQTRLGAEYLAVVAICA